MAFPQLTMERAKEMLDEKTTSFVRLPPHNGTKHRNGATLLGIRGKDKIEVQPRGHGHPEVVSIVGVTEHKSKTMNMQNLIASAGTTNPAKLPRKVSLRPQNSESQDEPTTEEIVVTAPPAGAHRLYNLYWAGPIGRNRGWTKDLNKARIFDSFAGARRAAGHLKLAPEWKTVIGGGTLDVETLAEAKLHPLPPQTSAPQTPFPVVSTEKKQPEYLNGNSDQISRIQQIDEMVASLSVPEKQPEPKAILPEPKAILPEPKVEIVPRRKTEIQTDLFDELRSAYQDYETAFKFAMEARQHVLDVVGKMSSNIVAIDTAFGLK